MELQAIEKILKENKNKSFIKRILEKDKYPVLQNKDGSHSTHLMAWGSVGKDKFIVFPTILLNSEGNLQKFSPQEAFRHVMETGNFILFKNKRDAEQFSKEYKKVWGNDPVKY